MRRFILCAVLAGTVLVAGAAAQQPEAAQAEVPPGAAGRLFDHFVVGGGAITWFMLIPLSVATVALSIEYCLSIRRAKLLPDETFEALSECLQHRRYVEAVERASQDPSMLGYVIHTAMGEASHGLAAMERAIEEAVEERSARLHRKVEYLNIIGSIAPLIGLFGTVYGMIGLFISIREAGGIPEPARIADNLSIALVTTFWGLLIAIPALSVFAVFRNRIEVLSADCALQCERLLSALRPGAAPPASAPATAVRPAAGS